MGCSVCFDRGMQPNRKKKLVERQQIGCRAAVLVHPGGQAKKKKKNHRRKEFGSPYLPLACDAYEHGPKRSTGLCTCATPLRHPRAQPNPLAHPAVCPAAGPPPGPSRRSIRSVASRRSPLSLRSISPRSRRLQARVASQISPPPTPTPTAAVLPQLPASTMVKVVPLEEELTDDDVPVDPAVHGESAALVAMGGSSSAVTAGPSEELTEGGVVVGRTVHEESAAFPALPVSSSAATAGSSEKLTKGGVPVGRRVHGGSAALRGPTHLEVPVSGMNRANANSSASKGSAIVDRMDEALLHEYDTFKYHEGVDTPDGLHLPVPVPVPADLHIPVPVPADLHIPVPVPADADLPDS